MSVFGFILTLFAYIALSLLLGFYFFLIIMRKFNFANYISKFLFLASFLAIAIESWALIMINGGFNVYLKLRVDFSFAFIIIAVVSLAIFISGFLIQKRARLESIFDRIAGLLLPALIVVGFGAATIILFYNIVYFRNI